MKQQRLREVVCTCQLSATVGNQSRLYLTVVATITLLFHPQHCSGDGFLNLNSISVCLAIFIDIITLSDRKHWLLFNMWNIQRLLWLRPTYRWPNLNPEAWILSNPMLELNVPFLHHLSDGETEAQWYKLVTGIKGDSDLNCGSPCSGEGTHVFGESVNCGLQTQDSNRDSPMVMLTSLGFLHFSETFSTFAKWNGYYLPCSKSNDHCRWTVEVSGRCLA